MRISVYVFLIGLVITSFVMTKILDEVIVVQFDLNQIDTINGDSMYIHTENGKFINNYRSGVIFPNDKITYKTDLISNRDDSILVNATIKLIQGGKNVVTPIEINNLSLTKKGQIEKISQEFFTGGEGRTEVIIEYQISNSTTRKQIDLARLTGGIEVLSLSNKLQSDQYYTVLVGVIASSIIGGGTLTVLYFTQKTSNKQIDLLKIQNADLKNQFEIQNRPWVVINPLKFHLAVLDNREIPWEEYLKNVSADPNFELPKEVRFIISCKNIGSSPARVIQYRYRGNEKITLEQLKQQKPSENTLLPSQEMTWVANAPYLGQEYFIAFLVEYSYNIFNKKGSDFIGTQWRYYNRDFWNLDEWSKE